MSRGTWSFFRNDTGEFSDVTFCGNQRALKLNTPAGCSPIAGAFDRTRQRVDVETGRVVAYERPAAELEAEQRAARDREARQRIAALERAQLRPMREAQLDPANVEARTRLQSIETEIASLRGDLAETGRV
jgi:hypothetical protein